MQNLEHFLLYYFTDIAKAMENAPIFLCSCIIIECLIELLPYRIQQLLLSLRMCVL